MEAVNNYIIVKKDSDELVRGGIILPSFNKQDGVVGFPFSGIVESVGDMVSDIKVGDHVVFDDLCTPWIFEDIDEKKRVLIMKDSDIIGILNG